MLKLFYGESVIELDDVSGGRPDIVFGGKYYGQLVGEREWQASRLRLINGYAVAQHEYNFRRAIELPGVEGDRIVFRRRNGETAFVLGLAGERDG